MKKYPKVNRLPVESELYPTFAGEAKLRYRNDYSYNFGREKDVITLNQNCEMYELLPEFVQFLSFYRFKNNLDEDIEIIHFGGTDERPFFVELSNTVPWKQLWYKDTNLVFNTLKPPYITSLEKKFGAKKTIRQGDWFFYPISMELDLIISICGYDLDIIQKTLHSTEKKTLLGRTRHTLEGRCLHDHIIRGVVSAEDHKEVVLPDWHFAYQTYGLKSPAVAD